MPRQMKDTGEAFRAVITRTTTHVDGRVIERTTYEGPYATVGAARSRITWANPGTSYRNAWDKAVTVTTGHVERASTNWVDADAPDLDVVTITRREYDSLKDADRTLDALTEYGVDNWEGYGDALSSLNDDEENDDA